MTRELRSPIATARFAGLLLLPLAVQAISIVNDNRNVELDIAKIAVLLLGTWLAWLLVVIVVRPLVGMASLAFVVGGIGIHLSSFSMWSMWAERGGWVPIEPLSWLAATAAMAIVVRLLGEPLARRTYLAFFSTMLVVGLISLVVAGPDQMPRPGPTTSAVVGEASSRHDLVIIILDGFGRADVLEDLYAYDRAVIENGLRSIGAEVVPGALANYTSTSFSVPSILSLGYSDWPTTDLGDGYRLELEARAGGSNEIGRLLQSRGYRYTFLEAPWSRSTCGKEIDRCVEAPFYDDLAELWIVRTSPLDLIVPRLMGRAFPESVRPSMVKLRQSIVEAQGNQAPDFIVAHILSPHAPYTLGNDCATSEFATYATQAECVSRLLLQALRDVGGSTVLMVVGDHGPTTHGMVEIPPEDWQDEELGARLPTLAGVRLLKTCDTPPDRTTLVNISRSVVACALGISLPPIEDRVFLVSGDFDPVVRLFEKDPEPYYDYP